MKPKLLSDYHISVLACYAESKAVSNKQAEVIANLFHQSNLDSYNYVTGENKINRLMFLRGSYSKDKHKPVELLKAIKHLYANCMDHPSWHLTDTRMILEDLTGHTITDLPGYDTAALEMNLPVDVTA